MDFETAISSHTTEQIGSSESGNIWSHPQPDTLLMENFFNDRRNKTLALPEERLMLAILEDAVASFQEYCAAKDGKRKQLFNDVEKWFFAASSGWIFDFETICGIAGFDPDYFRKGCCTGRNTNYQTSHAPLGSTKKTPELSYSAGVGRVMTDLFENDFARPLTEVNGNEYQVL